MTTLAVPYPAAAPTPFERTLLALSSRLTRVATERMRRRAALAELYDRHSGVGDAQRDVAASMRAGLLPR